MTQTEDQDDSPSQQVDSPGVANQHQIHALLAIVSGLQPYLLITQREVDSGISKELDGGVVASASVTFANACERLDKIMADESRWDLKKTSEVQDAILKSQRTFVQKATEELEAARASQLPHRVFRPDFTRHGDQFIAYYGNLNDPDSLVIGSGPTPLDAVREFDAAFHKLLKSHRVVQAPAKPEPEPEPAPIVAPAAPATVSVEKKRFWKL